MDKMTKSYPMSFSTFVVSRSFDIFKKIIIYDYYKLMSTNDSDIKKNISNIFIEDVKNFLSLDDNIAELKNKLKKLTSEKNIYEEKI